MYFLSLLSSNFNIIIDRMIGAPVHSKDIMDVMNSFHNRYLKGKMCMVGTSAVDYSTKIMEDHVMVWETKLNWAITYKKITT